MADRLIYLPILLPLFTSFWGYNFEHWIVRKIIYSRKFYYTIRDSCDWTIGYMAFLPLAKTQPLCFWQFGFITVNLTKLWLPTVIFTVLCQIYTWLFKASDKNTAIALSYSQFHAKNTPTYIYTLYTSIYLLYLIHLLYMYT